MSELTDKDLNMKARALGVRLTRLAKKSWLPNEVRSEPVAAKDWEGPNFPGAGRICCRRCGTPIRDHPFTACQEGGAQREREGVRLGRSAPLTVSTEEELRAALQQPEVFFL